MYGDPDVIKKYHNTEHAFCIINHRGDLDWMIGWVIIERIGMLGVSYLIEQQGDIWRAQNSLNDIPLRT